MPCDLQTPTNQHQHSEKQINQTPKALSASVLLIYAQVLHPLVSLSCCHIPRDSYRHGYCHCESGVLS